MDNPSQDIRLIYEVAKSTFPDNIAKEIISLEKFRTSEDFLETYVSFGGLQESFSTKLLVNKISEKINNYDATIIILDKNLGEWSIEIIDRAKCNLKLVRGSREIFLPSFWALSNDVDVRKSGLDFVLKKHSVTSKKFLELCKLVEIRPLNHIEIGDFFDTVNSSEEYFSEKLKEKLQSDQGLFVNDFVDTETDFLKELTGSFSPSENLDEYIEKSLKPLLYNLATKEPKFKSLERMAIISGHQKFSSALDIGEFNESEIAEFVNSNLDSSSLFSLVALAEYFLPICSSNPALSEALEKVLATLIDQITDENSIKVDVLSSLIIMCDSEISKKANFKNYKSFERRNFSISLANLLFRIFSEIGFLDASFVNFVNINCLYNFYIRTLLDLKQQPRWIPEFVATNQLKAEALGRLSIVYPALDKSSLPAEVLAKLDKVIDLENTYDQTFQLKKYYGGPLDTSSEPVQMLNGYWNDFVENEFNSDEITTKNFNVVINLAKHYLFPEDLLSKIIAKINSVKGALKIDKGNSDFQNFFVGMSYLAHANRRDDLATSLTQSLFSSDDQMLKELDKVVIFQMILSSAAAIENWTENCEFLEANIFRLARLCEGESDATRILPLIIGVTKQDAKHMPPLSRSIALLQELLN